MEEIFEFVRDEIRRSGYSRHLGAGVVLTGGGSLIKGTVELAQHMLELPVRLGIPTGFSGGFVQEVQNPQYSTGVGLVLYELKNKDRTTRNGEVRAKISVKKDSLIKRMTDWFNDL